MDDTTESINSLSLGFVEGLYADYLLDPNSVDLEWQRYFREMNCDEIATPPRVGSSLRVPSLFNPTVPANGNGHGNGNGNGHATHGHAADVAPPIAVMQDRVDQLIRAYRVRGHMVAQLDPLGIPRPEPIELNLSFHGFTEADLDRPFSTRTIQGPNVRTLRDIVNRLRNTYCQKIGVQFMHIDDLRVRNWLQERMEGTENRLELTRTEQLRIFTRLTDAVIFEDFIQKKYIGAKSFSLEGAESLIPLLDLAIEKAGEQQIGEIVLGMAHRGRLNVLANIMGKSPRLIFREFEDSAPDVQAGGDVKYHLGFSSDWMTAAGQKVHLSLCFNPSHLEFVNPVALGRMRAKQDYKKDAEHRKGMVLLIHGDAAFAGEGVVQETLNLGELPAYTTGGTIHVIANNQIGFTTPPHQGRSTPYATDVAKMLQSPIFHVNGESPEAVAQVVRLAMDFRAKFQRDVVIDMYCYRQRGHNEGDEPSFTQPLVYQAIEKRKSTREGYLDHLLALEGMTRTEADAIAHRRREHLERELSVARRDDFKPTFDTAPNVWTGYVGGYDKFVQEVDTSVPLDRLKELLAKQTKLPDDFHPHAKVERLLRQRAEMAAGEKPLDWAAAEALAFASLLTEGHRLRMTGQDCERGTFSHRHSVLHDVRDGHQYMPFKHLAPNQAPVDICNSPLSEIGVLGFEYGYSLDAPDSLVIWEAQFGDFVNCAQVIIDQFIASAEEKWRRLSGLVMLLPHGFEGMGPEHSSARLERFLALFADDNLQVTNPTTPAQYFHLLRRQVVRPLRKPLVVMTPKSLLRHPEAVSSLEECSKGKFRRVLPDAFTEKGNRPQATRVLLCSGKLYYELDAYRREQHRDDVAIVRIEQLTPPPVDQLQDVLAPYTSGTPVVWVQEEPENMGAWSFLRFRYGDQLFSRFPFSGVTRPASASPAIGSAHGHKRQQQELIRKAFA